MRTRVCLAFAAVTVFIFAIFLLFDRVTANLAESAKPTSITPPEAKLDTTSSTLQPPFKAPNTDSLILIIPTLPLDSSPTGVNLFSCCAVKPDCANFSLFTSFEYSHISRMAIEVPLAGLEGQTCRFKYMFTSSLRQSWPESGVAVHFVARSSPVTDRTRHLPVTNTVTTPSTTSFTEPVTTPALNSMIAQQSKAESASTADTHDRRDAPVINAIAKLNLCQPGTPVVKYTWSDAVAIELHSGNCSDATRLQINIRPRGNGQVKCDQNVCDVLGLAPSTEYQVYVTTPESPTASPPVKAITLADKGKCVARNQGRWFVPASGYDPMELSMLVLKASDQCSLWDLEKCVAFESTKAIQNLKLPMTDIPPLKSCATCFGVSAKCGLDNCMWSCGFEGKQSSKCLGCIRKNCRDAHFLPCTGLPLSQVPPEPPAV